MENTGPVRDQVDLSLFEDEPLVLDPKDVASPEAVSPPILSPVSPEEHDIKVLSPLDEQCFSPCEGSQDSAEKRKIEPEDVSQKKLKTCDAVAECQPGPSGVSPSKLKISKTNPGPKLKFGAPSSPEDGKKQRNRNCFRYGNYGDYYVYRNHLFGKDDRLSYLKDEWFRGKNCLDIGCNVGQITYNIAKKFGAARIVGVDIDGDLVVAARKNIKFYAKKHEFKGLELKGRWRRPPRGDETFPFNVGFIEMNYIGESDSILLSSSPEYHTILCLSVTKWVHLNFGDEGLMRLFKRVHRQLLPGGRFILEPQPWESYRKAKKYAPVLREAFLNLKLLPENFLDILIKEIGFEKVEVVGVPSHDAPGFSRPIQVYYKKNR